MHKPPKNYTFLYKSLTIHYKPFQVKSEPLQSIPISIILSDFVNGQTPFFLDGWQSSGEYICLLCESPFSLESTWKLVWDQKVSFIVTLLTSVAKVTEKKLLFSSFGQLNSSQFLRSILVQFPDSFLGRAKLSQNALQFTERWMSQKATEEKINEVQIGQNASKLDPKWPKQTNVSES